MESFETLGKSQRAIANLALEGLNTFWEQAKNLPPAVFQQALTEYTTALVDDYGKVASTAAAEWYERERKKRVQGNFTARVEAANLDAVAGSIKWLAGDIVGAERNYDRARSRLEKAVVRNLRDTGRRTIVANARRDPARPRWARAMRGRETCAWCRMLASRGFAYHSEETAGADHAWGHDSCDCEVIPDFSLNPREREIYDAEVSQLHDEYAVARARVSVEGLSAQDAMKAIIHEMDRDLRAAVNDPAKCARELLAVAARYEPNITHEMQRLAVANGGRMAGLDYRLKGEESLTRKIQQTALGLGVPADVAARTLSDVLRYTMVLDPGQYKRSTESVLSTLKQGGWITRTKNFWENEGYRGINVQMVNAEGLRVELQFHTETSLDVKEKHLHPLYEKHRVETSQTSREVLEKKMRDIGAKIPIPPGAEKI